MYLFSYMCSSKPYAICIFLEKNHLIVKSYGKVLAILYSKHKLWATLIFFVYVGTNHKLEKLYSDLIDFSCHKLMCSTLGQKRAQ